MTRRTRPRSRREVDLEPAEEQQEAEPDRRQHLDRRVDLDPAEHRRADERSRRRSRARPRVCAGRGARPSRNGAAKATATTMRSPSSEGMAVQSRDGADRYGCNAGAVARPTAHDRPHPDAGGALRDIAWDFSDLRAVYINCTLKRSPDVSHTQGLADRSIAIMERQRRHRRAVPRDRPRDRHRRLPGHDRARVGARRLAGDLRARDRRRHPRAADADLARREVVGLHAGDRAALRQQPPAQRRRPVRVLRPHRRLPGHRQRGRRQALRDERPLLAPAPRLHDPAAGRRRLDRRGRARARATSTRTPAGPTTTSRTATPRS